MGTRTAAAEIESSNDLEKKIDSLTAPAPPYYSSIFKKLAESNLNDAMIVCDFLTAEYNFSFDSPRATAPSNILVELDNLFNLFIGTRHIHHISILEATSSHVDIEVPRKHSIQDLQPAETLIGYYQADPGHPRKTYVAPQIGSSESR
jgi:hypothetical protein